jgi:hypothetical protein
MYRHPGDLNSSFLFLNKGKLLKPTRVILTSSVAYCVARAEFNTIKAPSTSFVLIKVCSALQDGNVIRSRKV